MIKSIRCAYIREFKEGFYLVLYSGVGNDVLNLRIDPVAYRLLRDNFKLDVDRSRKNECVKDFLRGHSESTNNTLGNG
jgi:hypothetical protein